MMYFEEMQTKYGFSDGNSIPIGIEKYRAVYCKCLNAMLYMNDSKIRVIPYDRGGCHNWCLILKVSKDLCTDEQWSNFSYLSVDEFKDYFNPDLVKIEKEDEAYDASVDNLLDKNFEFNDIDNLVEVKVEIKQKELDLFVESMRN